MGGHYGNILKMVNYLVGAAGFEPTTCSTQNCRATRLRYTPTIWEMMSIHAKGTTSKALRRLHGRLKNGCATRSPGAIPYFLAVPPITSSTPFASPPDAMILVDRGSVFSAIRRIRPSAPNEDHVERDVGILHPHRHLLLGREIEQHPLPVRQFLAVHQAGGLFFLGRRYLDRKNLHAGFGGDLKRLEVRRLRAKSGECAKCDDRSDPKPRPRAMPINKSIGIHGERSSGP